MCIDGPLLTPPGQRHLDFPLHRMLRNFSASWRDEPGSRRAWSPGLYAYGDPFSVVLRDRDDRCASALQSSLLPFPSLPFSPFDGGTAIISRRQGSKKCCFEFWERIYCDLPSNIVCWCVRLRSSPALFRINTWVGTSPCTDE